MTVHSVGAASEQRHTDGAFEFAETPLADPTPLLRKALAAEVHPSAFRAFAAALLRLSPLEPWSVHQIASAAGITHHAARFAVSQLTSAGLLAARRSVRRDADGVIRDLKLYHLVGGGR